MSPRIAWIGVGNMGKGMCRNLVERGNLTSALQVFNRTEEHAIELRNSVSEGKITVASTAVAAIQESDLVFICLNSYTSTEEVLADSVKMGPELLHGKLFVDCSTIHPALTRALAAKLGDSGAALVACPLLGVPPMAASGQLVCLLAGPSSGLERVIPYLDGVMSRAHILVSDTDVGLASTLKIVANTFVLAMVEALAEGLTLAEKAGLGSEPLEQVLAFTFPGMHQLYAHTMSSGNYHKMDKPMVNIEMALKDTRYALQLAEEHGVAAGAVKIGAAHLEAAKKHVGAHKDAAGIYGAVRQESGLEYEN